MTDASIKSCTGKINISIPCPPPYKKIVWDFTKSDHVAIRNSITGLDWPSIFHGLNPNQTAEEFTNKIYLIIETYVPNKVMVFNDKDPPWITKDVKVAIKRKHRVFLKF